MNGGWIKLWRKSLHSQVWADPDLWRTWACCLLLASHKESWVKIDRMALPVKISPGQFITGRFEFFAAMYPRKKKSNPSPLTVWRWMQNLENMGNLNIKSNKRFSLITIINWDSYQNGRLENEQQNEQQVNNRRTTSEQQTNTFKNEKKLKNEKKPPLPPRGFAEFWNAYPKKKSKGQAEKTWVKLGLGEKDLPSLLSGIETGKRSRGWQKDNGQYIPHPSTWLNARGWEDEPVVKEDFRVEEKPTDFSLGDA